MTIREVERFDTFMNIVDTYNNIKDEYEYDEDEDEDSMYFFNDFTEMCLIHVLHAEAKDIRYYNDRFLKEYPVMINYGNRQASSEKKWIYLNRMRDQVHACPPFSERKRKIEESPFIAVVRELRRFTKMQFLNVLYHNAINYYTKG